MTTRHKHGEPISVLTRAKPGKKPRKITIKCPSCGHLEDTLFWHEQAGGRLCQRCWNAWTDTAPHTPAGWVPANKRSTYVDPFASRLSQPFAGEPPMALN